MGGGSSAIVGVGRFGAIERRGTRRPNGGKLSLRRSPYAKIMGCVQNLVHAGSLALKNKLLRGAMVRDKTRPKP